MATRIFILLSLFTYILSPNVGLANEAEAQLAQTTSNLEEQIESLMESALLQNPKSSSVLYQSLASNLDRLHQQIDSMPFDERRSRELIMAYSWLRVIAIDLRQQAWVGAAIAANQMNGEIIRFINYRNENLRDIAWMDYLARDLMLLSKEDSKENLSIIDLRKSQLVLTWQRIRSELIKDFHNKSLAMKGDNLIRQIKQEKNVDHLIQHAVDTQSLIDTVENRKKMSEPSPILF